MAGVFAASHFDPDNYAKSRTEYPPALYDAIFRYHAEHSKSSDKLHLAVDIGAGPGQVTKVLANYFDKVIGVDPSDTMVATAKKLRANQLDNVEFRAGAAEDLPFVESSSVEMVTSGTAAHWYPSHWWQEAQRICKPGATVALFTVQGMYAHPNNPHAKELQSMIDTVKKTHFDPYAAPGNWILHNLYDELPLAKEGFSECTRVKWNLKGALEEGQENYILSNERTVDDIVNLHYSFGPVNTFNKNNPDLVGSPDHPLEVMRRDMKALGFANDQAITIGHTLSLLLFTRK